MVRITYAKKYYGHPDTNIIQEVPDKLQLFFNETEIKSVTVYGVYNNNVWYSHNRTFHVDGEMHISFDSKKDLIKHMESLGLTLNAEVEEVQTMIWDDEKEAWIDEKSGQETKNDGEWQVGRWSKWEYEDEEDEEDEEKEKEEEEERVDSDGEYIFRPDEWYYGIIPENTTKLSLVEIMANAILRVHSDMAEHVEKPDRLKKIVENLDLWFQHDSEGEDEFDHLVPEEDFDQFMSDVLNRARELRNNSDSE